MDIADLPTAPLLNYGDIEDAGRPVLTMSYDLGPSRTPVHSHSRAQLFYCRRGVFRLLGRDATWVVPPTQAVWVPSNTPHGALATQPIALLSLFIDASAMAGLPDRCLVVNVPALLRELFLRAVEIGNDYPRDGSAARLMRVLVDQLHDLTPAPLSLPLARDKRLQRLTDALLADPADPRGLKEWSPYAGASVRTLERQFISETGLSFAAWRRQLRLLEAIERLGKGQSVTRVALDLGYQSPSAFIAMFRRTLGAPPGRYFDNGGLGDT